MPRRISVQNLNASSVDIINVIRQNASYDYQQSVPEITTARDIPKVGEALFGSPALSNSFMNALVNRIALVIIRSTAFNNPYRVLKKGYLEFGETIEEIFVNIAKVVDYNPEKANQREFARTLPDVQSAFHAINWKVMYPTTISDVEFKQAFLSASGVYDLVAKIVDSLRQGMEYDEFLLFKYLLIKKIAHGGVYTEKINISSMNNAAVAFRGMSNNFMFMSKNYNELNVLTSTNRDAQVIFMSSDFNAKYDVEVLAAAFNMEKADFMGRLFLIDDFATFDNERWDVIRENSNGLEEVTSEELTVMSNVKAILADEDFFQIYDNLIKFTETYVASTLNWNYWLHNWKTVSASPFANIVAFVDSVTSNVVADTYTLKIVDKTQSEDAVTLSIVVQNENASLVPSNVKFIQTEELTVNGIGVHPYGAYLIPADAISKTIKVYVSVDGTMLASATTISSANKVGDTIVVSKKNV